MEAKEKEPRLNEINTVKVTKMNEWDELSRIMFAGHTQFGVIIEAGRI